MTLSLAVVYATMIWLLKGVIAHQWWLSLACFSLAVYLVVELNNCHALLRIRSRMVSTVFILLSCMASTLFEHVDSCFLLLGMVAFMLVLFHSYQNSQAAGTVYYAFALFGICSCFFVKLLFLLPVLWLLMATQLLTLNGRLLTASLLGVSTPYWFVLPLFIFRQDFEPMTAHFRSLLDFTPFGEAYQSLTVNQVIVLSFTALLLCISIYRFWKYSFEDKIRIRLIYGFITVMSLLCIVCLLLQPQLYQWLMPLIIVFGSPLIAHFFTFTSSKQTNILFMVTTVLSVLITIFNLWMPSLNF